MCMGLRTIKVGWRFRQLGRGRGDGSTPARPNWPEVSRACWPAGMYWWLSNLPKRRARAGVGGWAAGQSIGRRIDGLRPQRFLRASHTQSLCKTALSVWKRLNSGCARLTAARVELLLLRADAPYSALLSACVESVEVDMFLRRKAPRLSGRRIRRRRQARAAAFERARPRSRVTASRSGAPADRGVTQRGPRAETSSLDDSH